jgi:hypothetical protein
MYVRIEVGFVQPQACRGAATGMAEAAAVPGHFLASRISNCLFEFSFLFFVKLLLNF